MSSVEPSGSARPLRGVAFGMFGLAAIALVVGVMSLTSGENSLAEQSNPPATSSSDATAGESTDEDVTDPTEGDAGGSDDGDSEGSTDDSEGSADAEDPADGPDSGTGGGEDGDSGAGGSDAELGSPSTDTPLRIFNNSTIRGLAADAAEDFEEAGWDVAEVENYSAGIIETTTAYYRPGTAEEGAAGEIGSAFGIRVEPRFDGIADLGPGVVLIVTNDYGSTTVDPK
ncbi:MULTISPECIES: LytR C-terminal domain-containing protein [Actinoalloteichus]|uniref:LytR cell envelope-related transcriptional attenuator n=1 Tax=Actinoalloteichus fjordicus TaxID=1612552 RepID=A0AAC9L772_9PSEU|nr:MULTISPECIES: LytR C-terminal domain-containing protein [Actinoalloteichus]APU12463.1 LytR cell envelope-related transcriptional attenuator [Actinoalloteichus fjordicus]APU18416.1 LytR cell envelope-related transcriptional attenuator [Actinoalloteichus sp. GBA129-24]